MSSLKSALMKWRDEEAARKGVEGFRVLQNATIDEIARCKPVAKQDFLAIKGIKDAKYAEYGKILTGMVLQYGGGLFAEDAREVRGKHADAHANEDEPMTVSAYLDRVNDALSATDARVLGEVSSVQSRGAAVYFSIKDTVENATLSVFMWARDYNICGVALAEGLEVIVTGACEVYKPSGRLSLRARTVEYVGEGALKKAYDELRKKLEAEGLFAPERKRAIPDFPERIGVITSKQGAVIHDFQMNLGRYGYKINFFDSRVEGVTAVRDLLLALRHFAREEIDVLVMIRGGGSLESLQAFNNEQVVRAVAAFPRPTLVAIGHEKDVPLVDLVADYSPSTPTACATALNRTWQEAEKDLRIAGMRIADTYDRALRRESETLREARDRFAEFVASVSVAVTALEGSLRERLGRIERVISERRAALRDALRRMATHVLHALSVIDTAIHRYEKELRAHDPFRRLKQGYSVLFAGGKLLRSVEEVAVGQDFEARLADGSIEARVIGKHHG